MALNLYEFVVRKPGKATEKYGLRAYDEIILAPMVNIWLTYATVADIHEVYL